MGGPSNLNLKWSFGNEKLAKLKTVGFSIPALKSKDNFVTCPMAGACASVCYARQGRFIMPSVSNALEFNLAVVRKSIPNFIEKAKVDLTRIGRRIVRIHAAGDFFSQEYLDAWYDIARSFPDKKFYAYTKMINLNLWGAKPKNFTIIQSVGGKLDALINIRKSHSRIFSTHYARRQAGYVDGTHTDRHAINGTKRIALVYHGVKNLTPTQDKYFR